MPKAEAPPSSQAVSAFMSRVRRRNTAPELAIRRALHRRGVRFRLHRRDLPGRPDIVLVRARTAVFVDGCFWHGCPDHFVEPKSNRSFWLSKIRRNKERDQRVDDELREAGWTPVRIWEHEESATAAERLLRAWAASAP